MHSVKHLLTGAELTKVDIQHILSLASQVKKDRTLYSDLLKGQHVAIIFDKPSLRTRFSFTVAIHELGGQVIESVSSTRKTELPKDMIRVLEGYCSAVVIRTFADSDLNEMAEYANVPIINALTNSYHPCQSLADLLTLQEHFGTLEDLKIAYIGDGNNVLQSLMMMATSLGINVHIACPAGHGPNLAKLENPELVTQFSDPQAAVQGCHAVYTDVWTSMGFENNDESAFVGYQVNEALMSQAQHDAVFMHCMPMERGKEVSETLPDLPCSVIFQQSQNRLHVQKALLISLLS